MVLSELFMDKDLSKLQGGEWLDEYSRALMGDWAADEALGEVIPEVASQPTPPAPETMPVWEQGWESTDTGQPAPAEVPAEKPAEATPPTNGDDPEVNEILDALFWATEDAQVSTQSLWDIIKASWNEEAIAAFDKMQEDLNLKDQAIADLKAARDEDANTALIQDAELSKMNRVVSVVKSDDTLKQVVGYMSQYTSKPDLKPKLQWAIEELYEKITWVKISDLKDQANNVAKRALTNPSNAAAAPEIKLQNNSSLDEYGKAMWM